MTELVFFMIISSGSIFGAVRFKRKFEETAPLTCFGIVALLFLSGVCGILKAGVITVFIISAVMIACSLFVMIKNRDLKGVRDDLLTPGAVFFTLFFLVLIFLDRGKLAAEYDEFTHWIDCVKEMAYLDDFVTNPASGSAFASYPPSMALFQYFYQKIFLFLNAGAEFSEWRCFLAFQILSVIGFLPFFRGLSFRRPYIFCASVLTVILMPLFYYSCYSNILIDPFLGMLTGAGLSRVFLEEKKDRLYDVYMMLIVSVLALAKDAGQFFAAFTGVYYAYDVLSHNKNGERIRFGDIARAVSVPAALIISRLLWKLELVTSKAEISFGKKVDLLRYARLIVSGGGEGFERISISNFINAFFEERNEISALDIQIPFFHIFFLNAFLLYGIYKVLSLREKENRKLRAVMVCGMMIQTALYVYSLGATYISNFSESEAMSVAAYGRYMGIGYLPFWIIILMSVLYYLAKYENKNRLLISLLILCLLLVSPMEGVTHFLMKQSVRSSVAYRQPYEEISRKISENCEDDSRIGLIYQYPCDKESYWVINFNIRPVNHIEKYYQLDKDEEGNLKIPAEKLEKSIRNNCDYVAVFRINEDFSDEYGQLFENSDIYNDTLYRVDKTTGKLKKVL